MTLLNCELLSSPPLLPSPLDLHNPMLALATYHYLYYHLLYALGMAHVVDILVGPVLFYVFGIPVGPVLFYVFGIPCLVLCFYLSMFVTVFVPVIYYFK